MSRIEKLPSGCWEWSGPKSRGGYGIVGVRVCGAGRSAHRVVWVLMRGEIPPGVFVCHHCDNPPCCNPDHLFLGTNRENILDASSKGRLVRGAATKEMLRIQAVGRKPGASTRVKMSEARKGSGNGMFGKKHTDDAKAKQRAKKVGRPQTAEHIAKRVAAIRRRNE